MRKANFTRSNAGLGSSGFTLDGVANRQSSGNSEFAQPADCQSATRQVANLRYGKRRCETEKQSQGVRDAPHRFSWRE